MVRVAVVIPVFNPQPGHLERAVASVQAQTLEDWACVVVDDGSTTPVIVHGDARVCRWHRENHGVAASRNAGASIVDSEYVAFLDQDDEWLPGKLERQIGFMGAHGLGMSDTVFEFAQGDWRREGFDDHRGELTRLRDTGARMGHSTVVFRRDAFEEAGGFDESLRFTSDWDLQLKVAEAGWPFARLDELLALIHWHAGNESRDHRGMRRESIRVARKHGGDGAWLRRHYAADSRRRLRLMLRL